MKLKKPTQQRTFLLVVLLFACGLAATVSAQNLLKLSENVVAKYKHLPLQRLFDTAEYHYKKNQADTALQCYNLFINRLANNTSAEHQSKRIKAFCRVGVINIDASDYYAAHKQFIKALSLCEEDHSTAQDHWSCIYNNLGNIYYHFGNYDMAKSHYLMALSFGPDSVLMMSLYNNIGSMEVKSRQPDSAFYYLQKSLQISKELNGIHLYTIWDNIASLYQQLKRYDSAFYYFRLSLDEVKKHNDPEQTAVILSDLSRLFFELKNVDSALFYVNLSSQIAGKNGYLKVLEENYLLQSKIEKFKGHKTGALEYFEKHAKLKDSILNIKNLGDINYMLREYEISKTNEQIEQMTIKQYYQQIIQIILLIVSLVIGTVLVFVWIQKKRLNTAYTALFGMNLQIMELQNDQSEKGIEKYKNSALSDDMQDELLNKILAVMEDTSVICDTEFSILKLAELVQSNQAYVSQVINNVLKQNFRSFLSGYRIREARRLFSEQGATRYTIESVAYKVGFKSRSTFCDVFKDVTGVSPNFYFKSMQKKMQKKENKENNEK